MRSSPAVSRIPIGLSEPSKAPALRCPSYSYNGDHRAAYLLLDDFQPTIRRVEYDVSKELKALSVFGLPHSDWIIRTLESASAQMPWLLICR
jgi:hypothetical protein